MKRLLLVSAVCGLAASGQAEAAAGMESAGGQASERKLEQYFRVETEKLAGACLAEVRTLDDWKARRGEYRRQLQEMLGLDPWPERGDLKPVVTGRLEREDFTVEKLHFQALPGLYVTGNLYLPVGTSRPAPAVLYMCGHSRAVTNGVSFGNKTGYQHHGAWLARNGYVCLVVDTVQLGELEGKHRGTYNENQWWWNARGYTPAGVEAWLGIRSLDYLCSRPEVDANRIGMTGRSGGGSYTWTVAALDERVKVVAPVAGMTDLRNQVVDGAVDDHCDCMFFLNSYRWDFPMVAALIAPRPLLIGNSDKDTIFPLDGVVRLHASTRRIYELHGAASHLGLLITEGPHEDTQDLQVPVFRWFERWLKQKNSTVEMAAKKFFAPAQLRVFDRLPAEERNTRIEETFVAERCQAGPEGRPYGDELIGALLRHVFAGWPEEPVEFNPVLRGQSKEAGVRYRAFGFNSQAHVDLTLHVLEDLSVRKPERVLLTVLDELSWTNSPNRGVWNGGEKVNFRALRDEMKGSRAVLAFFGPRGVGEAWTGKPSKATQVRRRFMLLGQTLDGMRVWDIRCAANGLKAVPGLEKVPVVVRAEGTMGVNAAYAALFEPGIARLQLSDLPKSHRSGPDYLNVMKVTDIPEILEAVQGRLEKRP